jgi:integrase
MEIDKMIRIICRVDKKKKTGECPLYLCVTKNRKRIQESIGISINPEFWDFEDNTLKKNCPNKLNLEKIINDKKNKYLEKAILNKAIGIDFTARSLKESVKSPTKQVTVQSLFDEQIELQKSMDEINYSKSIRGTMYKMQEFNKHLDILFSEIDVEWCKRFEYYMRSGGGKNGEGLKPNTIGIHFRNLRTLFNIAIKRKYIKRECYPFDEFNISRFKNKTTKRALNKVDIVKIIQYGEKAKGFTKESIDLFAFMYYVAGINITDVARLTKDNITRKKRYSEMSASELIESDFLDNNNIKGDSIKYTRKKTNQEIEVPLCKEALDIINRYVNDNNDYLFSFILNSIHITERSKTNRIHKINGKVYECLKEVTKELKLDIDFNLTTYVARHSFATVLKRSGVPTIIATQSMGHSSEKVTQHYLDDLEDDTMREAFKNLSLKDVKIPATFEFGNPEDYVFKEESDINPEI